MRGKGHIVKNQNHRIHAIYTTYPSISYMRWITGVSQPYILFIKLVHHFLLAKSLLLVIFGSCAPDAAFFNANTAIGCIYFSLYGRKRRTRAWSAKSGILIDSEAVHLYHHCLFSAILLLMLINDLYYPQIVLRFRIGK